MDTLYSKYQDFIIRDPRTERKHAYAVSEEFMIQRHKCFLGENLQGKNILDLGSCVGSLGAYALHFGASSYTGIEYDKDLADISSENLIKYFPNRNWVIINTSVENFFETNEKKFDIVIASGIIHAVFDSIKFCNHLAMLGDTIVIESTRSNFFDDNTAAVHFVYDQRMIWGKDKKDLIYPAAKPSVGFLKMYMDLLGFDHDEECFKTAIKTLPDVYNIRQRFMLRFIKTKEPRPVGFLESSMKSRNIEDWMQ